MSKTSTMLCLGATLMVAGCTDRPTTSANPRRDDPPVNFCCGGIPIWSGTLLALPSGSWTAAGARGINDSSVVVGYVQAEPSKYRPVRWTNGVPSFLVVTTQDHWALPNAINSGGDIVGQVQWISGNLSQPIQPVRWLNPGFLMQTLATLGWDGWALDINSSRVAVGTSRATSGGAQHAVKWSASGTITDLNPAGAQSSRGYGINEQGEVVGTATFNGSTHGWKWYPNNTQLDLGLVVNGIVPEINSTSEAVGTAVYNGVSQAVMWTPNGTVLSLGAGSGSVGTTTSDARRYVGVTGSVPWTKRSETTPVNLPLPSGASSGHPFDVNRCGAIVGYASGGSLTMQMPAKWSKTTCDL